MALTLKELRQEAPGHYRISRQAGQTVVRVQTRLGSQHESAAQGLNRWLQQLGYQPTAGIVTNAQGGEQVQAILAPAPAPQEAETMVETDQCKARADRPGYFCWACKDQRAWVAEVQDQPGVQRWEQCPYCNTPEAIARRAAQDQAALERLESLQAARIEPVEPLAPDCERCGGQEVWLDPEDGELGACPDCQPDNE